jgi:hypothetical protein
MRFYRDKAESGERGMEDKAGGHDSLRRAA